MRPLTFSRTDHLNITLYWDTAHWGLAAEFFEASLSKQAAWFPLVEEVCVVSPNDDAESKVFDKRVNIHSEVKNVDQVLNLEVEEVSICFDDDCPLHLFL